MNVICISCSTYNNTNEDATLSNLKCDISDIVLHIHMNESIVMPMYYACYKPIELSVEHIYDIKELYRIKRILVNINKELILQKDMAEAEHVDLDELHLTSLWMLAKYYAELDMHYKSIALYEILSNDSIFSKYVSIWMEMAKQYVLLADIMTNSNYKDAVKHYNKAKNIYARIITAIDITSESPPNARSMDMYWTATLEFLNIYLKLNEPDLAIKYIERLRFLYMKANIYESTIHHNIDYIEHTILRNISSYK